MRTIVRTKEIVLLLLPILLLITILGGCAWFRQARFDQVTYLRLTDMKAEVGTVYRGLGDLELNEVQITEFRLKMEELLNYEKAKKEEKNKEMIDQIEKGILKIFNEDVEARKKSGPWNSTNIENSLKIIRTAFDQAIRIENSKNR